ncbi:MAG: aminodeoxychorismate synthase component I [Ignavibacteriales bacterium]|nr:aminodeoxychorismate synthase component I [Ignavibacteriales bacterium]
MKIEDIINKVVSTPNAAFFFTPQIYGKSDSYLFLKPKEIITVKSLRDLDQKLSQIDNLVNKGIYGYSLINYEAGYLLEKSLNYLLPRNEKLFQFFFYDKKEVQKIKSFDIDFSESEKYKIKNFKLNKLKDDFVKSIKKIKSYIEEGDTYQVNYTIKGNFNFSGSFSGLFNNLVFNQSAKYTSIINNSNDIIISLSPELFFEINKSKIISKPMKGTSRRGIELTIDALAKYELENSEKNRAENVMIVDMIRNDLGKISKYGSVKVKNLFEVEKYESVYQMVSTIEAKMRKNISLSEVIKNIFPCGSITGAPKIRTMEIINELEKDKRNIYTGGIGLIRNNKITFNVPIRTLTINKKSGNGTIGLGSGVVWDSVAEEEYEETKLKGNFLSHPEKPFEIFETMLLKDGKIFLVKDHLNRMQQTAEYFLFCFDKKLIESQLNQIIKNTDHKSYRIRIALDKFGKLTHSILALQELPKCINVIISNKRVSANNKFQYFKTTNRILYNSEYKKYSSIGFFDVIFINESNEISEGAITNIFIHNNDIISTPHTNAGILPGVYRKHLLKNNSMIRERRIYLKDLIEADKIVLTNSVRGEIEVGKLYLNESEFMEYK